MFPKSRLEALTDGIFAVAMTILVLDLRIPEELAINGQRDLAQALIGLEPKLIPYLLSFYVLGSNWFSLSRIQASYASVSTSTARWTLCYLLMVTLVPFASVIVGRFASYPLATWLYLLNIGLMAAIFHQSILASDNTSQAQLWADRRIELRVLVFTVTLAAVLTPLLGGRALYVLLLNIVLVRVFKAWQRRR